MRSWARALVGALALLVLLPAAPALAHAAFLGSDPADGSVLQTAPDFAELRFSEEVLLDASRVTLLQLGPGTSEDLPLTSADGGTTLRADLPTLGKGAYLLRFVAIDPADLHKTVGTVSFGIGVAAPPSESGAQLDGPWWTVALRAITDGALIVGAGAVIVIWLATRRRLRILGRLGELAVVCAAVVSIGWIALFVADVAAVGWAQANWARLLIRSDPGRRALIGVELALGVWWSVRLLAGLGASSRHFVVRILLLLNLGFVVLAVFGGHASTGGNTLVGLALRTAHYGSLCAWIGAVAALWWAHRATEELDVLWPDVSRSAAYGIALTGVSGLLLSGRLVATVTALLSTTYGRIIVAKFVLLGVLGVLGALAARRVVRAKAPNRLPVELGIAAVALVLAGVLAGSAPALGAQFDPPPRANPQIATGDAADLTVSASLQPARPGPNLVRVSVLDTRRPSPGTVEQVTFTLERADGQQVVTRTAVPVKGVVEWADVNIETPGEFTLVVTADRPASPVPPFRAPWLVSPTPTPRADTVISDRVWAPLAAALAVAWLVLVVAGRWWTRRAVRGRTGSPSPAP